MIDRSPFPLGSEISGRPALHEEGDATTAWIQRDRGGDEKTRTGDLTPLRLSYRKKHSQKNPCPVGQHAISSPKQHIIRACTQRPTLTVEGGDPVPTTNRPSSPFTSLLLLPPIQQRKLPPCPLHGFLTTYPNPR